MLTIGIAGGSGSGKTTVVKKITQLLPPDSVSVLSQDAYTTIIAICLPMKG